MKRLCGSFGPQTKKACAVISAMINPSRSSHMPLYHRTSVQPCSMQVTACPTSQLHLKRTCSLLKRGMVCISHRQSPHGDLAVTDENNNADLITYCERQKIPYALFENWSTILATTKDIYEGKTTPKAIAEQKSQGA